MTTLSKINKALTGLEVEARSQQNEQDELTLAELFFYSYLRFDKTGTVTRTPDSQNLDILQPVIDWLNEQRQQGQVFILLTSQELQTILTELDKDNFIMSPSFKGNDLSTPHRYFVFIRFGLADQAGHYEDLTRKINTTIDSYCHQTGTPYPDTIEQVETLLTLFLDEINNEV